MLVFMAFIAYRFTPLFEPFHVVVPLVLLGLAPIAERIDAFDGRHYEPLREAARYLAAEFPTSAVQLYRRMVVSTLKRASANQYDYAVRYLKEAENLTIDAGRIEDHDDFVLRLRQDHGRKWKFWGLYDVE